MCQQTLRQVFKVSENCNALLKCVSKQWIINFTCQQRVGQFCNVSQSSIAVPVRSRLVPYSNGSLGMGTARLLAIYAPNPTLVIGMSECV